LRRLERSLPASAYRGQDEVKTEGTIDGWTRSFPHALGLAGGKPGGGEPLLGRLMVHDALEMSYRTVTVHKDPECAICGVTLNVSGMPQLPWTET